MVGIYMTPEIPAWLKASDLEQWTVQPIAIAPLQCECAYPQHWQTPPEICETPFELEYRFAGGDELELLTLSLMPKADPTAPLRNWVEAFIQLSGFPLFALKQAHPTIQLTEWRYEGNCPQLAQRLQVDDLHLYQGFALLPGIPKYAHLYVLLARRDTLAWKVGLSLLSACFPGMPEATITQNDHFRAGTIFASIRFG
jgi:hypothetical protein